MVERLLASKRADAHPDYHRETFEELLGARFETSASVELSSGTRSLYHLRPR
jgi:hypothetical protein